MQTATYLHKCSECQAKYSRNTFWIDPQMYSDPKKATKLDTFWCPVCQEGQSVDLQMLPNVEVVEIGRKDYRSIMAEDSPRKAIFKQSKVIVQKITEDLSLEAISKINE